MNNKKAFKSGIWYTISNFLIKGIGFITTPIFTRLLSKEEFGVYNNYLSWLALFTIFVTLNLESTLISARYDYEDKFDEYILSVLSLSTLSAVFWLMIVNMFPTFFGNLLNLDREYINIMFVYLAIYPSISMFQAREQYYFEYKKNVLMSLLLSIGTALLSVLIVLNFKDKLKGRVIGSVILPLLLGVVLYAFFVVKGKRIRISYWKYAVPICLPYIPHLLSMTLLNSTDRVMITKLCNAEQTALYSLAYTCGTMVTILLSSLNGAYAPWLGEKLNEERNEEIRKFSYTYIVLFFLLAGGIMLVSPEVLYILGGKSYMEAVYVMAPVAMGCCCQFLYTMFVNIEQFKKKTIGMAIGSAVAAFVNFVLNLIFIPKFGYLAAAYTTLVGYLVLLAIHMYLVKRLGLQDIYDYKFIVWITIIGIVFMISIAMLYSCIVLRYIVLIIYCITILCLIIKYKNKIIEFIKKK